MRGELARVSFTVEPPGVPLRREPSHVHGGLVVAGAARRNLPVGRVGETAGWTMYFFKKIYGYYFLVKTDVAGEREEVGAVPDAGHLREGNKQLRKRNNL